MTGMDVEHTKALAEKAQLGHLVAVTSGVRNGDHWYICDDNESVAMISANDGNPDCEKHSEPAKPSEESL